MHVDERGIRAYLVSEVGPSELRALYIIDKDAARRKILEAMRGQGGCGRAAARELKVEYQTLARFIKSDAALASQVLQLKRELRDAGIPQRGFGERAERKLSEYRDNPRAYR